MLSVWNTITNEIKSNTFQYILVSYGVIGMILVALTYYNDEDIFTSLTDAKKKRKIKKEMRKIEKSLIRRKRRMQVFREKMGKIKGKDNNYITSDSFSLNRK
uniref:Transmembrane protein n=1 Tax=Strongyloides venezuelensis TaxID=75913 RepID=A0A0K0FAU4_STRVS